MTIRRVCTTPGCLLICNPDGSCPTHGARHKGRDNNPRWPRTRRLVLTRDHYSCRHPEHDAITGGAPRGPLPSPHLIAHRIDNSYHDQTLAGYITLCQRCHSTHHAWGGGVSIDRDWEPYPESPSPFPRRKLVR